ncbi:MAG: hypothetical protein IT374_24460 [Polyangiaceae bacterium]|nr:hypothetical protein [Polyangiaceae bacterium]
MSPPITLKRAITVEGWRVTGTIAVAAKREWEPALLKLAVQRGAVTSDMVVGELLGGRSGVARRLIEICGRLGLLEQRRGAWLPTEAGRETARTGVVLVPERGTWTVWGATDPLLVSAIVAVSPWREPPAFDERGKEARRAIQALPSWLTGAVGRPLDLLGGEQRAIRIDDLGKAARGEAVDAAPSLRATVVVTPAGTRLHIAGTLAEVDVAADAPPPAFSYDDVWSALLRHAGLERQWDTHRRALWVAFKETSAAERSSMIRALRVDRPVLGGLGRFDDVVVEPVPIRPWSKDDAAAWGEWRLVQGVKDYVSDEALGAAWRAAVAPFEDIAPACPTRLEVAARARGQDRPPPTYWRLQAPADWSMLGRAGR